MRTAHWSYADSISALNLKFCSLIFVMSALFLNYFCWSLPSIESSCLLLVFYALRTIPDQIVLLNAGCIAGGVGSEAKVRIKIIPASHARILLPISWSPSITWSRLYKESFWALRRSFEQTAEMRRSWEGNNK